MAADFAAFVFGRCRLLASLIKGLVEPLRARAAVRDAELRYAQRYRTPRVNPERVVIEVRVERVLGSSQLLDRSTD